HEAAAVVTYLSPGLRFFQQGQLEGRKKRVSPHLVRAPSEPLDEHLKPFYARLLAILNHPVLRDGQWRLLDCLPAWEGNPTSEHFIAFAWQDSGARRLVVAVNYSPSHAQCYVRLPFNDLGGRTWQLSDRLGPASYDRNGADLQDRGLY